MSTSPRPAVPQPDPGDEPATTPTEPGFGSGTLGRATAFVYWYMVVGALMNVGSLPAVLLLLLLGRSAGNVLLVPLCLVLYGPVLSAGLYALRDRTRSEGLTPARSFLRGLRLGWADSLKAWTPPMVVLAVLAGSLANLGAAGVPLTYAGVLVVIGVLVVLWALNALTIATFFSFRGRDVLRLAVFYIARQWRVTVGLLALVVVAIGVVWTTTEAVLWLFTVVWLGFLLGNARPLVADVARRFTVPQAVQQEDGGGTAA
ncbi:glycosyltransferase [Xylanimonas oleitrophica]|uniref:glycosyltransferase n=1 Tax=Xylanimonas oleitrophica TaxID=2607479 RepID=UPI0011B50E6B|nr:glycosyltransferase [Xylanimonas oleitrophica]